MNRNGNLFALLILFLAGALHCSAQEKTKEGENKLHHRVTLAIAHSHIPAANEVNGGKHTFIAATVGANYELWFSSKWAVGLHNDITMQSFNIEKSKEGKIVAREFPALTTVVAIYKPFEHWSFFAGPGREFEKHENFNVIKTGVEYGVELSKKWEVGFGAEYDRKFGGYSSWLVGIGISKFF